MTLVAVKSVGEAIKRARKDAKMHIEDAACKAFVGARTLLRYEAGEGTPPPDVVIRLAEAYRSPSIPVKYCQMACPIGVLKECGAEERDLASAVLGLLKEHSHVTAMRDKLISIAVDGLVADEEVLEFKVIMAELKELQQKIETLRIWAALKINKKALGLVAEPQGAYQYL